MVEVKLHVCGVCGKKFETAAQMKNHAYFHMANNNESVSDNEPPGFVDIDTSTEPSKDETQFLTCNKEQHDTHTTKKVKKQSARHTP